MELICSRKIDELGRIILPIDVRHSYELSVGDTLAVKSTEFEIILYKSAKGMEIERTIDELGRINIPNEIRNQFNLKPTDSLTILPCADGIHLYPKKHKHLEIFNNSEIKQKKIFIKKITANITGNTRNFYLLLRLKIFLNELSNPAYLRR